MRTNYPTKTLRKLAYKETMRKRGKNHFYAENAAELQRADRVGMGKVVRARLRKEWSTER